MFRRHRDRDHDDRRDDRRHHRHRGRHRDDHRDRRREFYQNSPPGQHQYFPAIPIVRRDPPRQRPDVAHRPGPANPPPAHAASIAPAPTPPAAEPPDQPTLVIVRDGATFHHPAPNAELSAEQHSASDASSAGGGDDDACLVCIRTARRRARLACGHAWCRRCLRMQVRSALRQGDAGWPPRCCATEEGIIGEGVVEWLGDGTLMTFYRRRRAEMDVPVADRVYCHVLTCSSFIPPAHHRTEEGGVNRIAECQVPECQARTCVACGTRAHPGGQCPQDPEMEAVMQTIEQHGYQFCSNCNAVVERIDGCNHIVCRHEFCYLCGARRTGSERFCACPQFGGNRPPRQANRRIRLEGAVRERLAAAAAPGIEPPRPQPPRPELINRVRQQQPGGVPAWEPDEELRRRWEQEDAEARRGPPRDDRRMEQWQQEDAAARRQMEEMMRQFTLEDAEARMALNRSPPPPPPPAEPALAPPPARAPPTAAAAPTPPPAAAQAPPRNSARRPTGITGRQPERQPGHLRERVHGPGGLGLRGLPDLDNPRAPPLPAPARARAPAAGVASPPPPPAAPAHAAPRNPRGPTAIPGRQPDRQPEFMRERVHGPGGLGLRYLPDLDYPVRNPATGRINDPATTRAAAQVRTRDPARPRDNGGGQAEAPGQQQQRPHPDADVSAYLNDPDVRIVSDDDPYRPPRAPPHMGMPPPPPYGYGMVAGPAAAPPPPPMVAGGMADGAGYPGVMTVTQTGPGSVRYQYNWGIGGGQGAGGHDPYGGAQIGMGGVPVAMVFPPAVDLRRQMYNQVMGTGNGHLHYETRW